MKINTRAVFEWSPKSKQYEEVYCDSYEYNGEVAECQYQSGGQPNWLQNMIGLGRQKLGGDQNRHRSWGTPQEGRFGTLLGGGGGGSVPTVSSPMASSIGLGSYQGSFGDIGNIRGSFSGDMTQGGFGTNKGFLGTVGSPSTPDFFTSDIKREGVSNAMTSPDLLAEAPVQGVPSGGAPGVTSEASSFMGKYGKEMAVGAGALLGGVTGFMQAKSQKKGLGVAIGELDPLKEKYMGEHERQLGLAESYRPGGKYSRYMGGQIMSQAAESAGQESQRMIASGITSPSMMRAMAQQSRRGAQASLPGMEMQMSQMALPYEQMGAQSLQQYGGVVEQLASLKGAKSAINPWASALSGGMQGAMGAASMMSSFASDRRMKKDIKYLHTSNDGHKVYSFKYKDGDTKYSGVMAQDVLKINPNAVTLKNGMFAVYYDMIDVDMQQLDII